MKQTTRDEYEKAVNRVIEYINKHLYDTPGIKELSDIAGISGFHFHRIFKVIVGENTGEYINRLRLENIAQRLRMTKETIEEIALRTGYGTKHALSKAFKKHFGIAPSVYRRLPQNVSLLVRDIKPEVPPLEPAIIHREARKIAYIRIIDWYGSPDSYRAAWKKLGQYAKKNSLVNEDTEYIGLSFDDPTITLPQKCRFYAAFTVDKEIKAEGAIGVRKLEGGLYAVFTLKGAYSGLIDLYFNIYINWLPSNGYKLRNTITFEKYLNSPGQVGEEELLTEICLPIQKA